MGLVLGCRVLVQSWGLNGSPALQKEHVEPRHRLSGPDGVNGARFVCDIDPGIVLIVGCVGVGLLKARPKKNRTISSISRPNCNVLRLPPKGHRRPAGHREEHDGLGNHRPCSEEPLRRSCRHHVRSIVLGHRGHQAQQLQQINCCLHAHAFEFRKCNARSGGAIIKCPARMKT